MERIFLDSPQLVAQQRKHHALIDQPWYGYGIIGMQLAFGLITNKRERL